MTPSPDRIHSRTSVSPPNVDLPADFPRDFRRMLLQADPRLSRFDPLPRIITFDDFDRGHCGWTSLVGNYEGSLDTLLPGYRGLTGPMLSTLSHWDTGSHGSHDGSYALKLATRAQRDALSVAIKRLTFRKPGPIRLEMYFTFKPEATELMLSDRDVKSVGFLFDLQVGDRAGRSGQRVMPHVRYLNSSAGELQQKWQFKRGTPTIQDIGTAAETVSHFHLGDNDWQDLPDGGAAAVLQRNRHQGELALPAFRFRHRLYVGALVPVQRS